MSRVFWLNGSWPSQPTQQNDQHSVANQDSRRNWVVALDGGQAVATVSPDHRPRLMPFAIALAANDPQAPGSKTTRSEARVADGWIEAFYSGEFGGSVWWFAPDGKARYQISDEKVIGFVSTPEGLLMLEGLAHLGLSDGSLRRLVAGPDGRWTSEPFVDLKDAPGVAVLTADKSLLVVTNERLSVGQPRHPTGRDSGRSRLLVEPLPQLDRHRPLGPGLHRNAPRPSPASTRSDLPRKSTWLLPSKAVAEQKFVPGFR